MIFLKKITVNIPKNTRFYATSNPDVSKLLNRIDNLVDTNKSLGDKHRSEKIENKFITTRKNVDKELENENIKMDKYLEDNTKNLNESNLKKVESIEKEHSIMTLLIQGKMSKVSPSDPSFLKEMSNLEHLQKNTDAKRNEKWEGIIHEDYMSKENNPEKKAIYESVRENRLAERKDILEADNKLAEEETKFFSKPKSLLDDFADTSIEPVDYTGGDD